MKEGERSPIVYRDLHHIAVMQNSNYIPLKDSHNMDIYSISCGRVLVNSDLG